MDLSWYQRHVACEWCGKHTRGVVEEKQVLCTSCRLPLLDDITGIDKPVGDLHATSGVEEEFQWRT
jgi:hypothetical protein